MKKTFILFVLGIAILLSACSTENPTNPNPTSTSCIGPQPKFQYKVNGALRVINATFDPRFGWKNEYRDGTANHQELPKLTQDDTRCSISCNGIDSEIWLGFTSQIISTGTYTDSFPGDFEDPSVFINGSQFVNNTVNITRFSNGTVDGTFTATVTNGTLTASITEGQFSNIPVVSW
jgi:hypothetical protein